MPTELTVLGLAAIWQVVQLALMSVYANLELGATRTLSPRDGKPLIEDLSDKSARLVRAANNHFEGLLLFTVAVVLIILGDKSSDLTIACACAYLAARVVYVPVYYFGLVPWRSIVWFIGFGATVLMFIAFFL